jgi:hypothetical protein
MNNHFVKESNKTLQIVIGCILMIPTLCLPFWGVYEMFFEPHYWKNRLRLYLLLRRGKVEVEHLNDFQFMGGVSQYRLTIEGSVYHVSIWNAGASFFGEPAMTLQEEPFGTEDYIGLFSGSLVTKRLNRKTIKMIQDGTC